MLQPSSFAPKIWSSCTICTTHRLPTLLALSSPRLALYLSCCSDPLNDMICTNNHANACSRWDRGGILNQTSYQFGESYPERGTRDGNLIFRLTVFNWNRGIGYFSCTVLSHFRLLHLLLSLSWEQEAWYLHQQLILIRWDFLNPVLQFGWKCHLLWCLLI